MSETVHPAPDGWLKRFFLSLVILALLAGLLLVPWAVCWLTASGELDQDEVVARQAQGEFVLFGPGLPQDIMAYKLALYAAVRPEVVVLGSSRAGNVRAAFFERPFVNMAGAATDLESLRLLVDRMLAVHRPKVVLLGLDFWWLTEGSPAGRPGQAVRPSLLDASTLRAPWLWLAQGRIAPADMPAPLQGRLRADRYGLEAQLRDTGYGPDGSLYEGAVLDGRLPAPDHAFARTLRGLASGSGIWAGSLAPDRARLEAFAEICCRLRSRGIRTIVFLRCRMAVRPAAGPAGLRRGEHGFFGSPCLRLRRLRDDGRPARRGRHRRQPGARHGRPAALAAGYAASGVSEPCAARPARSGSRA